MGISSVQSHHAVVTGSGANAPAPSPAPASPWAAATATQVAPSAPQRHGLLGTLRDGVSFGLGMVWQGVNEITHHFHIPFIGVPSGPIGDVLEPPGSAARAGARLIEHGVHHLAGITPAASPQSMRELRPLLATTTVSGTPDAPTQLTFTALAPGASWSNAQRSSALVAVYVDGQYHSTAIVPGERTTPITVNLGALTAGPHEVELRSARDRAPSEASPVFVHDIHSAVLRGDAARIELHAPIVELRDAAITTGAIPSSRDDAPLALFPIVAPTDDGGSLISYTVIFSNENGGTASPALMSQYGHVLDVEPIYRVQLNATGDVVREQYQTGVHQWRDFDGSRVGARPVLAVSSQNNMTTARITTGGAERWSDSVMTGAATDGEALAAQPWIRQLGERELVREGKVAGGAPPGDEQLYPLERYVSVGPVSAERRGAIIADGGLWLAVRDGGRVWATVDSEFAAGEYATGGALLPAGHSRDEVTGPA